MRSRQGAEKQRADSSYILSTESRWCRFLFKFCNIELNRAEKIIFNSAKRKRNPWTFLSVNDSDCWMLQVASGPPLLLRVFLWSIPFSSAVWSPSKAHSLQWCWWHRKHGSSPSPSVLLNFLSDRFSGSPSVQFSTGNDIWPEDVQNSFESAVLEEFLSVTNGLLRCLVLLGLIFKPIWPAVLAMMVAFAC